MEVHLHSLNYKSWPLLKMQFSSIQVFAFDKSTMLNPTIAQFMSIMQLIHMNATIY
jgi:hypothetical protein